MRKLGINGDIGATLREGLATLEDWLAPNVAQTGLRVVPALLVAVLAVLLLWRGTRRERPFFTLLGIAALCYAGLVLASRLFADAGIPLDERLLSPLFLLAALGVSAAVGLLWRDGRPTLRWAGGLVLAAWLGASALRTVHWVRVGRDGGWGYADQDWQSSAVVHCGTQRSPFGVGLQVQPSTASGGQAPAARQSASTVQDAAPAVCGWMVTSRVIVSEPKAFPTVSETM